MDAYSRMVGMQQQRYAQNADAENRNALGFAQLASEERLKNQALGLQHAELLQRPELQMAAIQQRAQLEMEGWITQQRFTLADRQELTRQENALGELVSKRDQGEISEQEFFQMARQVAPRVNALQAKDQHTQVKMKAQLLQEQSERIAQQKKAQEVLNAVNEGELESRIERRIPTEHMEWAANYMRTAYPDLKPGTPEYDAKMKLDMASIGRAEEWIKNEKGGLEPLSKFRERVQGKGSGEQGARDTIHIIDKATEATQRWAKSQDFPPTAEEEDNYFKKMKQRYAEAAGEPPAEKKRAMEERHVEELGRFDQAIQVTRAEENLPLDLRSGLVAAYTRSKELRSQFPPNLRTPAIQKQIESADRAAAELQRRAKESLRARKDQDLDAEERAKRDMIRLLGFDPSTGPAMGTKTPAEKSNAERLKEIFSFRGAPTGQ